MRCALTDSGLAFLLTLSALPACDLPDPDDPDPSESQGEGSSGDDPTDASQTSNASSSPSTSDATSDGADTTGDVDTTGDEPTSDSATDPSGDPTGSGGAICELYATNAVVCFPTLGDPAKFVGYCEQSLEYYGAISEECRALAEDVFACMSTADCDVLSDVETCATESATLADACG